MEVATAGRFVWYDLMTTEPEAAKEFYTRVTGWTTTAWDGPTAYDMWKAGEAPVGGVVELPAEAAAAGAPPHWIGYISVPDIQNAVRRATEAGARVIVPPEAVPDTGELAVLVDPQGGAFAMFSPSGDATSPADPGAIGHFSWHELATTDRVRAWKFYSRMFGWSADEAMDMGDGKQYQLFTAAGRQVGAVYDRPEGMSGPPAWLYYIRVPDLDAALQRVKDGGGRVLNGPMDVPGGDRVAQCVDPQGAVFALHAGA